jgi:hypothetical protein
MQSNAQEVINNGWHRTISLYIFPNSYSKSRPRKIKTKPPRFYAHLGKSNSESGSGKKNDVATKHGREVRHGVFQIGKGNVRNSCLALSLLVGISYSHMDAKMYKLERNRNIALTELYDNDDITKVYVDSGLRVGAVRVDQLHLVYAGYLKPLGVDLVVFSKAKSDTVVYDSRLGDNNEIVRITDKIIYLWLNDSHYDLILNPYIFSRCHRSKFCFRCMRYFKRTERVNTHMCRTSNTCQRCYASLVKCPKQQDFSAECNIIFYNSECFMKHLTQRTFKTSCGRMETACNRFFFCASCYKIVPRKRYTTRGKTKKHSCNEMFCLHCNKLTKKDHYCYIKPIRLAHESTHPTLFFYDFETRVNSEGYMVPFYCVVQKVCVACDEKPFIKTYEYFLPHPNDPHCDISVEPVDCCGYRQYVFEKGNEDIVEDLMNFIMLQPKGSVWVAHNGGRFDNIFLMHELLVKRQIVPRVIMNGSKIMCIDLEERNLKIIDSYLFISMRLSMFPKALGIKNLAKGFPRIYLPI